MAQPEAFILLILQNANLVANQTAYGGDLALECVTIPQDSPDVRDVYLIVRLTPFESPLDPSVPVNCTIKDGIRRYSFLGGNNQTIELSFRDPPDIPATQHLREDFETFDGILGQYSEFIYTDPQNSHPQPNTSFSEKFGDLRGHVVLVNEDNGEVVGELDNKIQILEDPTMNDKGREKEPVIIEIPEETEDARTAFVRAVPPGEGDIITKSASLISYAISGSTNLLLTAITSASDYAIKNTNPHSSIALGSSRDPNTPPPLPPRAIVLLTSPRTRKGLQTIHAMSGQAVQVSAKTIGMLDGIIRKVVGGKDSKGKRREIAPPIMASTLSVRGAAPRSSSPGLVPPPYTEKPQLPPRSNSRAPSPQPPPLPPRNSNTKTRLILSVDLILSTLDDSMKRILNVGGQRLDAVVGHKYGADAAQSTSMMTGTAKNIGLVYIDMRGVGRKAIVKRVAKEYMKSHASRGSKNAAEGGNIRCGL